VRKEAGLGDVELIDQAKRCVLIDDQLSILTEVKKIWGDRVTTVFPRQGHYAVDPKVLSSYPPAEIQVDRISDLLGIERSAFH